MREESAVGWDYLETLYEKGGARAVYDWANHAGAAYEYCRPCETETPVFDGCCALCGTPFNKE